MRQKILKILAIACVGVLLLGQPAYAKDPLTKLIRGIVNLGTCWAEYPVRIVDSSDRYGDVTGAALGAVKATWYTVWRAVGGAYDVATFLIPLPTKYRSIVEPANIFSSLYGSDVAAVA